MSQGSLGRLVVGDWCARCRWALKVGDNVKFGRKLELLWLGLNA